MDNCWILTMKNRFPKFTMAHVYIFINRLSIVLPHYSFNSCVSNVLCYTTIIPGTKKEYSFVSCNLPYDKSDGIVFKIN